MLKNKTILQIVPALNNGGVERGVIEISNYIVKINCKSIVISSGGKLQHSIERNGGIHYNLGVNTKNPFKWGYIRKKIEKIIDVENVDLIHVCSRVPAWITYPLSAKLKIPIISSVHSRFRKGNFLKNFYNSILIKCDYVIAISKHIENEIISVFPNSKSKIRTIYRGVDKDLFNSSNISVSRIINQSKLMEIDYGKSVILMASRPSLWKGHLCLIKSLKKINTEFQCILIGANDGKISFKKKLYKLIENLGLGDKVRLTPSSNDIQAALMLGDVIVMPSIDPEPFGRIIIEAQSLGKIVVGFDHGGISETIINGETGFLAEPKNVDSLSEKLQIALSIKNTERKKIIKHAQKLVETKFSHLKMCSETIKLYEKCIFESEIKHKLK